MLHDNNIYALEGASSKSSAHTHTRINTHSTNFIPSAHSIRGVWELPVPLEKPPPQSPHCATYLWIPSTGGQEGLSYDFYRQTGKGETDVGGGRGGGRVALWGGSPCRVRPRPRFARAGVWSSVAPGAQNTERKRRGGAVSGWDEAASAERKREVKTGEMSGTRSSSMTPYISPSAASSAARPPTRG